MQAYLNGLLTCLQPLNLIMLYVCTLVGCVLGAIPGLAGGLGITLILPLTFALDTNLSFCMLLGMYVGGISGSFISSVLVGIPGSAASIATTYDGYPLTQQGKASKALSIGITASFIGTAISVIFATLFSGLIADIALMLGPWEYFSLCLMAITLVASMSNGSIFKALLAAFIGVWLATIGTDRVTNQMRFTFGTFHLYGGINVIALLMGTFALQLVATGYAKGNQEMPEVHAGSLKGFGLKLKDFKDHAKTILISLAMGLGIGFLPGMGSGVAGFIAYGNAKNRSKEPETFGKGNEDGVWASETANNAVLGGALIPLISLGIPGDGTGVLLLSAMTIHGLTAGPMFIENNPKLANLIFACMLLAAVLVFVTMIFTKRWFPLLLKAPYHYLYSAILMICFLGAFSSTTSMFNVAMVIVFGLIGVVLDYFEIPMGPMMLAYILGVNLETYFRQGMSFARGDLSRFVTRPISLVFLLITLFSVLFPIIKSAVKKRKDAKQAQQ